MSFFEGSGNYKSYFTRSVILRTYTKKIHHILSTILINAHWLLLKKTSPFSFFRNRMHCNRGSITVEASIVFPLFLLGFINLLSIFDMIRLQSDMEAAVHQVGREMAVLGYAYDKIDEEESSLSEIAASEAFTEIYALSRIKGELGSGYVENSPIISKGGGLHLSKSTIMQDDIIDLVVEYKVKPAAALAGFQSLSVRNRCRMHAWTGYDIQKGTQESTEIWVYITESGEVYHLSRNCSYLRLSIKSAPAAAVENLRNHAGAKYYPCELCRDDKVGDTVFITEYGSRYHGSTNCSGLKRTVFTIPISEAGGRGLCKKCAV